MVVSMEESHEILNLRAAREILKSSIEKSRNISTSVDETGSRLKITRHNLAFLQAAVKNMACGCALYHEIRSHVDRAIGPSCAVLKVLDVVYELQDSLDTHPRAAGLSVYLTNIKRLQESLKLLAGNCRLVILWLEDVLQFLKKNAADYEDDWYLVQVTKVTKILVELQGKGESFGQDGGFLSSAFDNLETECRHLLTDASFLHSSSPSQLQAITEVFAANNRLEKCMSIYAEIRIANARATFEALNIDYLDIKLSEAASVQTVDGYIDQWDKHMEFAVRHLLREEYRLCGEVYKEFGSDVWMNCFATIASQCGFIDIFDFGNKICKCKKEAMKLLKLLKIFSTLDKLRLDFNDLFGGKFCIKIQNQTRDLVKKVVDGVCEVFWELLVQVELQRESSPPPDGSIPRLVYFVTEYCNQLLEDENSSILIRVLEIYQVWNQVKFEEGILSNEIHNIMKAVEINLETWAKMFNDTALSYLFMMNNHWYLCNNVRGTKLGDLLGSSWLWAHEESAEYYAALYMRESWKKLLVHLCEEGLTFFPGGRAIDRNLVKKRIGAFCEAFDNMYKKQSKWVPSDKGLSWKISQLIVEAIVPHYKSYLQRFMPGIEHETDVGNDVKYSAESLEKLIGSLFQLKLGRYSSSKCTDLVGVKNAAANHFSSTPAAA
ncbi:Exocyst component protein [Handroanthus impetiginosus]|uniref:Exocyst subunit Exo70 family protein n=1 Tax=Handroanthus impetiginosus TaxID=429701 RepID=A0A2G9HCJ2_9LAMI|nr:Exocyst component protein [Handroanthus impetiginosus]